MPEVAGSRASQAMSRYAAGDDAAFSALYDELAPRLYAYLRRQLRSASSAEDALQQAFLQIHLHRGKFAAGEPVEPWAYAIARASAIDLLRRERRRRATELDEQVAESSAHDAAELVGAQQLGDALRAELASVSPKLREAFLLVRIEGLSHAEAAQVLDIDEGATRVRAHRAVRWLRERLARFGLAEKAP